MNDSRRRWQKKKALFGEAVELAPEERAAFLSRACAGDEALRREVETLLEAADQAGRFLEDGVAPDGELAEDPLLGSQVGPWRLVGLLGHGGMGAVYLARRDDRQFAREAAIKVVRALPGGGEIERRFRAERRILASLDHPNIARLLDGGTTAEGLPYFVMERVEGLPITTFCDRHRLTVDERLALFRQVCAAVEAAHRNLVVHRDLKPSNILITERGEPKLLDFGIAKLLDPEAADAAPTRTAERPMTPEYASPEQIRGEPITTATDVYSLGVILYQLLTGRRPHEADTGSRVEIERAVLESEPERPSTAARATRSGPQETAARFAARRASPRELGRRLRGDLDRIVLTALRKEPERRYASVERLSDDVGRHLEGLPVAARGDSAIYRASKLARRNWAGLAAALLVGVSLVVGIVVAKRQERVAERERDRAERVSEVLQQVLASPDPSALGGGSGPDVTMVEVLRSASAGLGDELGDAPEVEVEVRTTLGRSFLLSGLLEEARAELERALEVQLSTGEAAHPRTAEVLFGLGQVAYNAGEFEPAEEHLRRSLALCAELDCEPWLPPSALNILGAALARSGRLGEAESVYRQGIELAGSNAAAPPEVLAELASSLGYVLMESGDLKAALAHYREADRLLEERAPDSLAERFAVTVNLASIAYFLGEFEEAGRTFELAVERAAASWGEDHLYYALARVYRGSNLLELGELDRARADSDFATARLREKLPEGHHELVRNLVNRAEVLCFTGDPEAAVAAFERALEALPEALDDPGWRIGNARSRFGRCLTQLGRSAAGAEMLRRGLADLETHLAPGDGRLDQVRGWLARAEAAAIG